MADHEHLCLLSALSPRDAGPIHFFCSSLDDLEDLTHTMAAEIVMELGEDTDLGAIEEILEESLTLSENRDGAAWIEEYLGRPRDDAWPPRPRVLESEDQYFDTAVVIGYDDQGEKLVLTRVDDFVSDENYWTTVIVESEDGGETRKTSTIRDGLRRGAPFFCWERPYRYFEDWMRYSWPSHTPWDSATFVDQFYRVVDSNRRTSCTYEFI